MSDLPCYRQRATRRICQARPLLRCNRQFLLRRKCNRELQSYCGNELKCSERVHRIQVRIWMNVGPSQPQDDKCREKSAGITVIQTPVAHRKAYRTRAMDRIYLSRF